MITIMGRRRTTDREAAMKTKFLSAVLAAMLMASCANSAEPVNLWTAQAVPHRMEMLRPYMTTEKVLKTLGADSATPGMGGGPGKQQGYYLRAGYRLMLKYGPDWKHPVKITFIGEGRTVIKQWVPDTDSKTDMGFGFPATGPGP
jgi:hypothetical protein